MKIELDNNRECEDKGEYYLITPKEIDWNDIIPLFCPKCNNRMKNILDANAYRIHRCCERCNIYRVSSKNNIQDSK